MTQLQAPEIAKKLLEQRRSLVVLGEPMSGRSAFLQKIQYELHTLSSDFCQIELNGIENLRSEQSVADTLIFRLSVWMAQEGIIEDYQVGNLTESAIAARLQNHENPTVIAINDFVKLISMPSILNIFRKLQHNSRTNIIGTGLPAAVGTIKDNAYLIHWIPQITKNDFYELSKKILAPQDIELSENSKNFIHQHCNGRAADIYAILDCIKKTAPKYIENVLNQLEKQQLPQSFYVTIWKNFEQIWFRSLTSQAQIYLSGMARRQRSSVHHNSLTPTDWKIIAGLNILNEDNIMPASLQNPIRYNLKP